MRNIENRLTEDERCTLYVHALNPIPDVEGVLDFDLDATLVDTALHAANHHRPLLQRWINDWRLTDLADLITDGHGPYSQRQYVKDTLFLVEWLVLACRDLGRTFPLNPQDALKASREYRKLLLESEKGIQAFSGINEDLALLRQNFPRAFMLLKTNCPDWLAPLRAGELLRHFDGIVSIRPWLPPIVDDDPYAIVLNDTREWLDVQYKLTKREELQLHLAIPQHHAKPSTLGLRAAIGYLELSPSALRRIVLGGDDPTSEGVTALEVFKVHGGCEDPERARFVHAAYAQYPNRESANATAIIDAVATTPQALCGEMERLYREDW